MTAGRSDINYRLEIYTDSFAIASTLSLYTQAGSGLRETKDSL